MEIDYGFIKNGEIDLVGQTLSFIPSQGKPITGLGDTQAKIKYIIMNEGKDYPEISIAPAINLPTGSVEKGLGWGKSQYILPLWIEKRWGPWTAYGGGGYTINPATDAKNYSFGGLVLQRNFTKQFALGAELYTQGAIGTENVPDAGSVTLANIGGTYNLNSSASLLLSVGHNIAGINLWYGYLGLNFYF